MYTDNNIETLERILKTILNGLRERSASSVIRQHISPGVLAGKIGLGIGGESIGEGELLEKIRTIIRNSVQTDHPLFMNQMYGDQNIHAVAGDILTTVLNTSMYTSEVAPVMTLIEEECIRFLGGMAGYKPDACDGVFTPGGSVSNMMAMVLARDARFPESGDRGLAATPSFSVFVSAEAHYSFIKCGAFLGIGRDHIVKVPTDHIGAMNILALNDAIAKEHKLGRIPLMVVATAGTTTTGVFDDLPAIRKIAESHSMWFHVDAVWGGSLLFSAREATKLTGVAFADSISWNLHKMMGIPIVCAAFLTRHKRALENSLSVSAPYLFHEQDENAGIDLGRKSLQCGRRVDALKLWMALLGDGASGMANRIDKMMAKARLLATKIQASEELSLFCDPQTPVVCFRYINNGLGRDQLNQINSSIRDKLFRDGRIMLNYSRMGDDIMLRCVISNPDIAEHHLNEIVESVMTVGSQLLDEYRVTTGIV